MTDENPYRSPIRRLIAMLVLATFAIAWSIGTSFTWPDATVARRWLDHPWAMMPGAVAFATIVLIQYWPRSDR